MTNICVNCGAEKELHQSETEHCPFGGIESPVGLPDKWMQSRFAATPNPNTITLELGEYLKLVEKASLAKTTMEVIKVADEISLATAMLKWREVETIADGIRMEVEKYILSKPKPATVVIAGIRARYNSPRTTYDHKGAVLAAMFTNPTLQGKLSELTIIENLDGKIFTALSKEYELKPDKTTSGKSSVTLSLGDE